MIDPRLAWFAIGATCSAVVFGWPWHPRFSRYSRRMGPPRGSLGYPFWDYIPDSQGDTPRYTPPDPRRRINHENTAPNSSEQRPRWFRRGNNGDGPTTPKPAIVPKPQFPPPRKIPVDWP